MKVENGMPVGTIRPPIDFYSRPSDKDYESVRVVNDAAQAAHMEADFLGSVSSLINNHTKVSPAVRKLALVELTKVLK